jgi:hypothetical protein
MVMEVWIARDMNGELFMFDEEPEFQRPTGQWVPRDPDGPWCETFGEYPEIGKGERKRYTLMAAA